MLTIWTGVLSAGADSIRLMWARRRSVARPPAPPTESRASLAGDRERRCVRLFPPFFALAALVLFGEGARAQTCTSSDVAITGSGPTTVATLVADCTALLGMKDTLRGSVALNWATSLAMSSWDGIDLSSDASRVKVLSLQNRSLGGSLTSGLSNLSGLEELSLDGNSLTGSIPALSGLANLEELSLSANDLTGSIPALSGLTNLEQLNLSANDLTGAIPALSGLTSLRYLILAENDLNGTIPALSGLTDLEYISLSDNDLTGSIPALSGFTSLRFLALDNNSLTGSIPALSGLPELYWADFSFNRLTGSIPDVSGLTSLQYLYLNVNRLTGSIDASHFPTSLLQLRLNTNRLTGSIPDVSGLTGLQYLYLNVNRLAGSIDASHLPVGLYQLYLQQNRLTGSIPDLSGLTNLQHLFLADNGLTGSIAGLGALTSLQRLGLCEADFDASETLPAALESLRTAGTLDVYSCVSMEDGEAAEGETVNFNVTFSTWPVRAHGSVELNYRTTDGTASSADYAGTDTGGVTIPAAAAGETSASATIGVPAATDGIAESAETFTVTLGWPDTVTAIRIRGTATGTIRNVAGVPPLPPPTGGPGGPSPPDDDDESEPEPEPPPPPPLSAASFDVEGAECSEGLCRVRTGTVVRFIDTSTGNVLSREWDFGDGRRPRSATVRHTWSEPGFYTVTLRVSDDRHEFATSWNFLAEAAEPAGACVADDETRCLRDSRFAVEVEWWTGDGQNGFGKVVREGTNDSGLFSFFDEDNWEMLIKVLDGCSVNGHVWVYGASATTLGYRIRVTDTVTDAVREYLNEDGRRADAIADSEAFAGVCGTSGD